MSFEKKREDYTQQLGAYELCFSKPNIKHHSSVSHQELPAECPNRCILGTYKAPPPLPRWAPLAERPWKGARTMAASAWLQIDGKKLALELVNKGLNFLHLQKIWCSVTIFWIHWEGEGDILDEISRVYTALRTAYHHWIPLHGIRIQILPLEVMTTS